MSEKKQNDSGEPAAEGAVDETSAAEQAEASSVEDAGAKAETSKAGKPEAATEASATPEVAKGGKSRGAKPGEGDPKGPKRGPMDTVMRGLIMVALGAFVTTPLWCQASQTENFRRTEFRADRADDSNSTEGRLAAVIRRLITTAAQDREVDEGEAMRELSTILAEAGIGTAQGRVQATDQLIGDILAQAAEADGRSFGQMQEQAILGQSRIMARTLITQLGGDLDDDDTEDPPGDWTNASWPVISGFQYEEGMELPAAVQALDGKDAKAWGYLLYLEGDQYLLVQSLWSCCFGQPPDLHEAIVIRANPNVAARFESRGVKVYGRFEASEMREDGYVTSLYRLDARHIKAM
ncbi:MAG: hypothetical protein KF901_09865 [Myxococcales bacterium]|nr:hypothetical protein [Myxococcales bacterium]